MSSWFTSLGKVTGDITASVQSAASKVQTAASKVGVDEELIQKLTLRTPELVSERARIDEEENRKEVVKNTLAELLPWETRDEEREILVEECKESILSLSTKEETFTTPEPLPGAKTSDLVKKEDGDAEVTNDEGSEKEASVVEKKSDEEEKGEQKKNADEVAADAAVKAAEVEAKVAKLAPLPPLLDDFDLDTHVGLIQRLFQEDQNLVEKHADLCGAGEREVKFWKNYFFHCAYARYEAGLSIDEIWAVLPASGAVTPAESEGGAETANNHGEETVTFDKSPLPDAGTASQDSVQTPAAGVVTASSKAVPSLSETDAVISSPSPEESIGGADEIDESGASDFEVVSESGGGGNDDLDDLEAEIARELGE
eukprot:CAMPEP_0113551540 /NCGR_PEP_ID=MMETSP0015_2-20120614/14580_1 /TAXON_ID=2838 /ORGANISM="Odontella" /LENGTH=370 /DNA_ID=CAMNT_0000452441 /DNA_START=149 /DNA_END=1261 /DNA_ORIENTATION=- /assembly_acc=CAM_ASM_000160